MVGGQVACFFEDGYGCYCGGEGGGVEGGT